MARGKENAFKKSMKKKLFKRHRGCQVCGKGTMGGSRHEPVLEIHHIIPVCEGGETTQGNALLVCRPCHVTLHQ